MANLINSEEVWKDIPGYEGYYQISNLGKVKSLARGARRGLAKYNTDRILKQQKNGSGYWYVPFCIKFKRSSKLVHVLMAKNFVPNPEGKPQVNHINGKKWDNRLENLEWCTASENQFHAIKLGLCDYTNSIAVHKKMVRSLNSNAKRVAQYSTTGELIKIWDCQIDAAETLGVKRKSISDNVKGRQPTAFGYIWKAV